MKIAFVGSFAAQLAGAVRQRLTVPAEVVIGDEPDILAELADAEVIVSMAVSRTMAEAASRLRLVQVPGAGLDRIDRGALRASVLVANTYGHETGIAEYIIGAMLAMTRSFVRLDAALRQGRWESQWAVDQPAPPLWSELSGKTLGILGYGHIGAALAVRARAFGMQVRAIRRRVPAAPLDEGVRLDGPQAIDDLLRESDHVVVTVPLTDETRNLLDGRRLSLMKPGAYLVNVARAEVIDEAALYQALAAGRMAGAALDVWYRYPRAAGPMLPSTEPFHTLDNVLLTPHISGWTEGMVRARSELIAGNIERLMRGEALLNRV